LEQWLDVGADGSNMDSIVVDQCALLQCWRMLEHLLFSHPASRVNGEDVVCCMAPKKKINPRDKLLTFFANGSKHTEPSDQENGDEIPLSLVVPARSSNVLLCACP
jgi:hypothetical protein